MPQPSQFQAVNIEPLSGPMDTRSTPDAVSAGAWRFRQNVMVVDQGKACRRPGWARYRTERPIYNNEDLHDQLLSLQTYYADRTSIPYTPQSDISIYPPGNDANGRPYCSGSVQTRSTGRQPVTFLLEAIATTGVRKLLAGTQNRLYALDEGRGNWQIIADAYGGDPGIGLHRRWSAAQVNDVIVFTNNYDPPLSYVLDSPIQGCAMQAVSTIDSLDGIGLSKAAAICSWKGTIFLGDVEMDGDRIEYRIVWSRYNLPLNFTPGIEGGNGTAGYQDLPFGGRILAMEPLQDVLLIYTTKSIWQCEYVGGEQVFQFTERYSEPKNGEGCLSYRRTLISTGKEHVYLGRDGIYVYNLFLPRPDRLEWMHRATSKVFETIDELKCEDHVAWFYPATKEYWVSWVEQGQTLPIRTLVLNTLYQTSDFVDHGFSAYTNHAPDDRGSLLDFLLSRGLCTPEELHANSDLITLDVKQGGYCDDKEAVANPVSMPSRIAPIWTNQPLDLDGKAVEDYTKPTADADSVCAILGDLTLEDLCQECPQAGLMVMACATDWTLKQYSATGGVYYRDVSTTTVFAEGQRALHPEYDWVDDTHAWAPCGTWRQDGYESILRTGAQDYGMPREDKNQRALELEYESDMLQVVPSALEMKIGYSAQAIDSNNDSSGRCALVWRNLKPRTIECLSDRSGADHISAGTRPNRTMQWPFLYTGRYFYFELRVSGVNGAVCFSRLTADVKQMLRSATS